MSERKKLVDEVALDLFRRQHPTPGPEREKAWLMYGADYVSDVTETIAALEAAGVRLVPVAWTDDDQTGLNAAVYDAMWHWEDRPIDVDDAMSLASALKASISDNGLMIVSAALKETGQ